MKEQLYALTEINDKFDFGQLESGQFYTVYYEKDSCPLVWSEWNIKRDFKLISYILLPIEIKTVSDEEISAHTDTLIKFQYSPYIGGFEAGALWMRSQLIYEVSKEQTK